VFGHKAAPVPSRIVVVHAAAYASVVKGSAIGMSGGAGNLPLE
jgi:hypothetical protein